MQHILVYKILEVPKNSWSVIASRVLKKWVDFPIQPFVGLIYKEKDILAKIERIV
jgi:hypothetical protein